MAFQATDKTKALPWAEMRAEWEADDKVSARQIAQRHRIETSTVTRRIHREAWERNPTPPPAPLVMSQAMAAALTQVADRRAKGRGVPKAYPEAKGNLARGSGAARPPKAAPTPPPEPDQTETAGPGPELDVVPPPEPVEGAAAAAEPASPDGEQPFPIPPPRKPRTPPPDPDIPLGAIAHAALAEMPNTASVVALHRDMIMRQISIGREIQATGLGVLRCLRDLVPSLEELSAMEDPKDQAAVLARRSSALRLLTSVNPDRDTLAGIFKATADVINQGILIERRAVGLDAKGGKAEPPAGNTNTNINLISQTVQAGNVATLATNMPATAAHMLKSLAREMREHKRVIDIEAQQIEGKVA